MPTRWRRLVAAAAAALILSAAPAFAATDTVSPPKPEPVLVLKGFKTTPASLPVGSRFKLELLIDNVVNADADNVVVTVGVPSAGPATSTAAAASPEVVVLGSNTRFLGNIAGKATNRSVVFDLISNPRGGPGPYSLPVTIQMDSRNGGRISSPQSVGLTFTRTLVFDVGSLTYPREVTAGKPFRVSVAVKNTNDFPVNGVALAFDSPAVDWVSRETTVGILEPGRDATLTATGIPQAPGVLVVTMAITYKDDYNQVKEIKREVTMTVRPKPAEPARPQRTPGMDLLLFLKALVGLGG